MAEMRKKKYQSSSDISSSIGVSVILAFSTKDGIKKIFKM